jgi:anthranilate synthase component 2
MRSKARAAAHRHLAGPCTPNEAGVSLEVIERLGATTPILGVCLGHQSIGQAYGGDGDPRRPHHARQDLAIRHEGKGVFAGLPDGYEATRYHSLVVERATLPDALEITAWTENEDGDSRRSWACATANSRWKACSSIPSRS